MRANGMTFRGIAISFKVSPQTIRVVCMTEQERKDFYKHRYEIEPKKNSTISANKSRDRLKKINKKILNKANALYSKNYRMKKKVI
jgi:hypothetical protein